MKFKKMTEEQIQLDVEKINGFLSAIEMLNVADNIGVDYTFVRLPPERTLLKSVERNITAAYPDTIVANWHISLEQVNEKQLADNINMWFFHFGNAAILNDKLSALRPGFMDMLKQVVYAPNIYRVTMSLPVWYAINWDIFAFDTKNGFFLLEFNFNA
ncbi:TPA: hypothetical protein U2R10_003558 [Proteus mirabilis]|uniref:Uncharacterized protein n=4 Tax=Enterobacterales TaxID=91347 RepID=A0A7A2XS46_ECOLX|nr:MULTISPECIES: hypothetical protein [Enterobacterales]AXO18456.1 hypothetical protein MC79_007650 [Providencia stuartii]HBC0579149.1 hypothetical protein [Serratia marcescens]ARX35857.1 hypothetical protein AM402_17485 [Proteus mirabilis]AWF39294.1 hypothetical protein CSC16_2340 [Proteus mirabilis]EFG1244397.1 hypothetical protein [Escherichia coli]